VIRRIILVDRSGVTAGSGNLDTVVTKTGVEEV